ncbi:something about silencing protein 10 [Coniosporium apollinis]|uniref:Something about silencing protein 10 n=1 Tax=Coniosporium apollinis TaxID=61459 RepID=A0ABQ9P2X8_9PEZI|nr:something about silencing protein 10 [Coniosporium apollinis]
MAKKRKASGHSRDQQTTFDVDPAKSKLRVDTYEDVADSEDEFHINRDKILLDEGPQAKRMRKWKEQDEFLQPSDEEVLAYDSPSEAEDLDLDDGDDVSDGVEPDSKAAPRRRRGSDASESEDDDEDVGGWGPSKKDYYNVDKIETEQDALDEEAEARRLQQKQLQAMTEADYGFDEADWMGAGHDGEAEEAREEGDVVTEVLPQLQIAEDMGPAERLKLLKTRYPEFEPLAKEFLDLQSLHEELALAAAASKNLERSRNAAKAGSMRTPVAVIKYRALAAYLAAISMYFALLTSASNEDDSLRAALAPAQLRDHPVMNSLVECRTLWTKIKDLRITETLSNSVNGNELSSIEEEPATAVEVRPDEAIVNGEGKATRKPKKTKAERAAEAAHAEAEARRAEKMRRTEEELAALSSLTDKTAARKAKKSKPIKYDVLNGDDSDFGDETELTAHEAAEKARRKKSLRFYTSQIAQKVNKRGAAGRDAGGDTDIPYRERLRDRQARLNAEAEKRGRKLPAQGEELGGESDEEDRQQARQIRGEEGTNDEDYYDMVAARTSKRKADKQAFAEAQAQAEREGGRVIEQEVIGQDGKRAITYAIQKNKGLTPKRKKDVRNPRVKKRKAFEDKKKKLGSIRQLYKGGEGRGGYKGELTGIKKGLVKSVKL